MRYTLEPVHEGYEVVDGNGRSADCKMRSGSSRSAISRKLINKMNRYSSLGVPKLADKRVSMGSALGHGIWSFLKHYMFKLGFVDGWAGFVIALGNFEGTFYRYAKRYEEMQAWSSRRASRYGDPPFRPDVRGRCRRCGGARERDVSESAMIPDKP